MSDEEMSDVSFLFTVGCIIIFLIACGMVGCPKYNVWQKGLAGEASLNRARQERKIIVEQAKAELDAAEVRAKAIAIVGAKAKQYPEYRAQEFIGAFAEALQNGTINQIIYVPTEGNIPILEAGRR